MALPVVTEAHHQQYHDFFASCKGKFPRQKLRTLADGISKDDPALFRFLEGFCGEFPMGAYAPYFMLKQAAGGTLPTIDDAIKAEVVQEYANKMFTPEIKKWQEKCPALTAHFLETTLSVTHKHDISLLELQAVNERIKSFVYVCAMVERQFDGKGISIDLDKSIDPPVFDAVPKITRAHVMEIKALQDRVADNVDTGYLLDSIKRDDPALLDFYTALTEGKCIMIPSSYMAYTLAAGRTLPRISNQVKAQVVQDFGSLESVECKDKVKKEMDRIGAIDLESMAIMGGVMNIAKQMEGNDFARQTIRDHILFYNMLERQIALNKEKK